MKLSQFRFDLPLNLIAQYPAKKREDSRMMVVDRQTGNIENRHFRDIMDYFEDKDVFVVNNTKVFPARMYGRKEKTGAKIEVFLLRELNKQNRLWDVIVDPARKIRVGNKLYFGDNDEMVAEVIDNTTSRGRTIRFLFDGPEEEFKQILNSLGETPLPKYIKRKPEEEDKERYQTVYAKEKGSVAAPTAGLHFTEALLDELQQKGVRTSFVSLHVGAGTFKPVKAATMQDHLMHEECIQIDRQTITTLLQHFENKKPNTKTGIVAVGTTAMRTLESLYWFGVKFSKEDTPALSLGQWYPYENTTELTAMESIQQVLQYMDEYELDQLNASTGILIAPGYEFKMVSGLITNFHQPGSTLILLVAAFIGENWRNIYHHALSNNYRFLSYGDSSLLLR